MAKHIHYTGPVHIPATSAAGGLDTPEWRTDRMKFSTIEETVYAFKRLLFEQEANMGRWNADARGFILARFGTGDSAPPESFVDDVIRGIESWLDQHPSFYRNDAGQWVWGVLD